ncbi:Starch-binding associating with outer membrane [Mariniphaga anaerophila]|uniref:Starch-binding associating with outer membrane n=1 Tax=Mariniphaga anaerophila TaxID=1484053 RepID=A0A1M5BPW1_9BACT|nr:RagB/SusD family nutrient uptake outer membrane protein [Mariniphaga anaerophila]SHF44633.1 Starch-binding associating with outer membrane [Mariniphaga anaerophila]
MKTRIYNILIAVGLAGLVTFSSCINDLDTIPLDKDEVTSEYVYSNPENYKKVLAKLYAGLAVSGQEGPAGMNDLSGLDEGFGQYLRAYWYAQELSSDEAVMAWNDGNLRDYQEMDWSSNNEYISNMYYRVFYQISLTNEFIRETSPEKLSDRGIDETYRTDIEMYRKEARFLRALSYWHAIDMFGNVPFVTEKDEVGSFFPEQISRAELFDYVETELLDIESQLSAPGQVEYGRADQAAVWTLLAKLYLNAEVYINQSKYTECLTYCNKILNAGYSLEPEYEHLFMADNHKSNEIIFPITQDGNYTKTYGGVTFIIKASVGGNMDPDMFGIDGGWAGARTTKQFVGKFLDLNTLKSARIPLKSVADYPVIYVPGGYQDDSGYSENEWAPETAPTLASVNSDNNYEGYIYFAEDNSQFKFTEGPNWDANWGDNNADGILEESGSNLVIPEAGMYKINVNLNNYSYTAVKTNWGLIGDATPGGWDNSTPMEFDAETKVWSVIAELGSGSFKFRANDKWDINLGDNDADGILEYEGSNMAISESGKYLITLYLGTPDYTYSIERYSSDGRNLLYSDGQTLDIDNMFEFTNGYAVGKFKNVTSDGQTGSNIEFVDTDFPLFRLADVYLMYAEAVLRGGTGGDAATALSYVNMLRERAYGDQGGNITAADLTLDFILDERGREFYWEAQRRTDLIRFGKFTGGDYLWEWKGAVKEGRSIDDKFNIFPIPASDVIANPNLTQNTGY